MHLTPTQTGLVGQMTKDPMFVPKVSAEMTRQQRSRLRSRLLESLADRLLQPRDGRGRKPAVQYPALSKRQLAERQRHERPLKVEHRMTQPTCYGILRA